MHVKFKEKAKMSPKNFNHRYTRSKDLSRDFANENSLIVTKTNKLYYEYENHQAKMSTIRSMEREEFKRLRNHKFTNK